MMLHGLSMHACRYCAQIKTVIRSSASSKVLHPTLEFTVNANCSSSSVAVGGDASAGASGVVLEVFAFSNSSMTVGNYCLPACRYSLV